MSWGGLVGIEILDHCLREAWNLATGQCIHAKIEEIQEHLVVVSA